MTPLTSSLKKARFKQSGSSPIKVDGMPRKARKSVCASVLSVMFQTGICALRLVSVWLRRFQVGFSARVSRAKAFQRSSITSQAVSARVSGAKPCLAQESFDERTNVCFVLPRKSTCLFVKRITRARISTVHQFSHLVTDRSFAFRVFCFCLEKQCFLAVSQTRVHSKSKTL